LGAFSNEPKRSDFKALGKISVTTENGMYKVLYGSYGTKEEAFKKREEIIGKGFDGFVVSYQDGVRVK
jgi:cell division protein FtsN